MLYYTLLGNLPADRMETYIDMCIYIHRRFVEYVLYSLFSTWNLQDPVPQPVWQKNIYKQGDMHVQPWHLHILHTLWLFLLCIVHRVLCRYTKHSGILYFTNSVCLFLEIDERDIIGNYEKKVVYTNII